jgi:hypothetical protein
MLIIGRSVAGMGGSGMMNGGLMILRASVPMEKSAAYLGVMLGSKFCHIQVQDKTIDQCKSAKRA